MYKVASRRAGEPGFSVLAVECGVDVWLYLGHRRSRRQKLGNASSVRRSIWPWCIVASTSSVCGGAITGREPLLTKRVQRMSSGTLSQTRGGPRSLRLKQKQQKRKCILTGVAVVRRMLAKHVSIHSFLVRCMGRTRGGREGGREADRQTDREPATINHLFHTALTSNAHNHGREQWYCADVGAIAPTSA